MADKKVKKKRKKKGQNVKIYARVRQLMPWEPRKTSLQVCSGNKLRNKTVKTTNEYSFTKVFGIDINNEEIFKVMVQPMINNVIEGFNAVLIAYGQTGSGKTFTMLGKPNLGVVGLLPLMLKEVYETESVYKLELSCVEAFGHHVAKIELFDLYNPENQTPTWAQKKGNTSLDMHKALQKQIGDLDAAYKMIRYAHAASHFAPTGKNPESSRGHCTFVSKVYQEDKNTSNDLISFFLFLDCAGSEGETAFTKDFIASIDKTTLMARRLEAGCINTGLSSLQIIFNELRVKGKLSNMLGNGLRRVLHPFITTRTFIAVIFCFSPAVNNCKATESTLKFAVTAGMVKVQPVKAELSMNVEKLVQQLRRHIEENDKLMDEQQNKIVDMQADLEQLKQELLTKGGDIGDIGGGYGDMGMGGGGGGDAQYEQSAMSKKYAGRNVAHLAQSVLDKFAYLDEDSDDDDYVLDDMFATNDDDEKAMQDLENELNAAFKADKKGKGAAKLLKEAVGIEYEGDDSDDEKQMDMAEMEAALEDTLDLAREDVTEIQRRFETIAAMTDETVQLDFKNMTSEDLTDHCEEAWEQIENNKEQQKSLKKTQEKVVGHLVETNEWLFSALQQTLNSQL